MRTIGQTSLPLTEIVGPKVNEKPHMNHKIEPMAMPSGILLPDVCTNDNINA
jgi:hypothetical protein